MKKKWGVNVGWVMLEVNGEVMYVDDDEDKFLLYVFFYIEVI